MKQLHSIHVLTTTSILIALSILLSFFKIPITQMIEIRFSSLPIALSGYLFGPVLGGIVGAMSDILGYIIRPTGPYFPGFTISTALAGILYGLLLHKKELTLRRILVTQLVYFIVIGCVVNTLNLSILYGTDFQVLFLSRLPKEIIMYPIQSGLLYITVQMLRRIPTLERAS